MVVDMALGFAGMGRVFKKESTDPILNSLRRFLTGLDSVRDQSDYDQSHTGLCNWFTENIRTAEKKGKHPVPEGPCSYGQAAKVVNISAKVFVYYCGLPSADAAERLLPILHAAFDIKMIGHLKKRFPDANVTAADNKAVNRCEYELLRSLVAREIREDFGSAIHPVQYDDIIFRRVNRGQLRPPGQTGRPPLTISSALLVPTLIK